MWQETFHFFVCTTNFLEVGIRLLLLSNLEGKANFFMVNDWGTVSVILFVWITQELSDVMFIVYYASRRKELELFC